MAKIQIKNSFITSSAQITISSSLVRFSDNIRAKSITGSFNASSTGTNIFVQSGNSFGTTALLGTNDNQPLAFETNGSERIRVTNDGFVGIGTSSPTLVSGYVGLNVVNSGYTQISAKSTASSAGIEFVPSTGYRWELQADNSNNWFVYDRSQALHRLLINSNGNVGIGTTSPGFILDVRGDIRIGNGTSGEQDIRFVSLNGDWQVGTNNGGNGTNNNQFYFYDNAYRLTIQSGTGNVGIGTISPNTLLNVHGANPFVRINDTSATGHGIKISYNNSDTHGLHLTYNGNGAQSYIDNTYGVTSGQVYGDIYFRQNVSGVMTTRMTIKADGGSIGIGTTSPATKLDVRGNLFVANAATGNNIIAFGNIGTLGPLNGAPNNLTGSAFLVVSSSVASGAPSHMKFFTTSGGTCGERVRISADGNLGIGNTSPSYKLDVAGSAYAYNYWTLTSASTFGATDYSSCLQFFGSTGSGGLTNTIKFITNGSEKMRITANGSVGIGTTAPTYPLVIAGQTQIRSGHGETRLQLYYPNATLAYEGYLTAWASEPGISYNCSGIGGNVNIGGQYYGRQTNSSSYAMYIRFDVNYGYTEFYASTGAAGAINGQGSRVMYVDSTGVLSTSGIRTYGASVLSNNGAIDPDAWQNYVVAGGIADGSGWGVTTAIGGNSGVGDSWAIGHNGSALYMAMGNGSANDSFQTYIQFDPNRNLYLVPTSGCVGIGTSSPSNKTTIQADATGASFADNGVGQLVIRGSTNTAKRLGLGIDTTNNIGVIQAQLYGTGQYPLVLNPAGGSVGIGTNSPGALLDLWSTAARIKFRRGSSYDMSFGMHDTSTSALSIKNSSDASTVAYFQYDGAVGIGTTSFSYTTSNRANLELYGSTDSLIALKNSSGNAYIQKYSNDLYINNVTNGAMVFNTNNSEKLRIAADGNIGIGTSSPSIKLAVDGEASFGDGSKLTMIGLDINSGVTPNFIKIRTKIPFASAAADFTINIKGFRYGSAETTNLSVCWHYYNSTFYSPAISSAGSFAPTVKLSAEDWDSSGTLKVCIVLVGPGYWPKLYVESMYSSAYNDAYADGWDWVDADATGTGNNLAILSYKSNFGNSFVMLSNGNVGIGTTNPYAYSNYRFLTLDDSGGSGVSFRSGGTERASFYGYSGGSDLLSSGYLQLFTGGSVRMYISNTGNVGIGTTTVRSTLHVNGDILRDTTIPYSWGTSAPVRTFNGAYSYANGGVNGVARYLLLWPQITNVNGQNGRFVNGRLVVSRGATHAYNDTTIGDVVATAGYNSAANLYSYTPIIGEKLYFYNIVYNGVTYLAISLPISDYRWELTGYFGIEETAYYSPTFVYANTSGVGTITQLTDYTNESLSIYNKTNNIGIGTTNPTAKLHIAQNNSGGVPAIRLSEDESTIQGPSANTQIRMGSNLVLNASSTMLFGTNGSEAIRVISDGNVGIGTTSPVYKLHVNGTTFANSVTGTFVSDGSITLNGGDLLFAADGGGTGFQFDYYQTKMYIGNNAGTTWHMVVQDNSNVGISTTSPNANLHVSGTFQVGNGTNFGNKFTLYESFASGKIGFCMRDTNGDDIYSVYCNSTSGEVRLIADDDNNTAFMTFQMNASERMRITNAGNVGIGTSNPIYKLDNYYDTIRYTLRTAEKTLAVGFPNGVANQKVDIIFDVAPGNVVFWGNLQVEITDGYNYQLTTGKLVKVFAVGLNPATGTGPYSSAIFDNTSYYTDAYGAVTDNYAIDGIFFNTTTGKYYITIVHRTSTGNTPIIKITGFGYAASSSDNINNLTAGAVYTSNTTVYYKPVVETLQSRIGYNGNINQSADLIVQGGVGIGTTSPGVKFEVYQTSNDAVIRSKTTTAGAYVYLDSGTDGYFGLNLVNAGTSKWFVGSYGTTSFTITKGIADTEYFRINTSGNVGIGTTSPKQKLDVAGAGAGSIGLTNTGTTGYSEIIFYEGNSVKADIWVNGSAQSNYAGTNSMNIWQGSNAPMAFYTNGSEAMRILSNGNVGIGTTSPVGKFDVRPDSSWVQAEAFIVDTDGGNNPRIRLYRPDGASATTAYPIHIRNDSGNLNILTGTAAVLGSETVTSKFYFTTAGNLGIGTTTTAAKLHVVGKGLIVQGITGTPFWNNNSFEIQSSGGNGVALEFHRAGYTSATIASMAGELSFYTDSGSERMRIITGTGNVGIGTTSPAAKLEVVGNVKATSFTGSFSGLPNGYLYARSTGQSISSGNWANIDIIFNNSVISSSIKYNSTTGVASLTANKIYRITSTLSWINSGTFAVYWALHKNSNNALFSPEMTSYATTYNLDRSGNGTLDMILVPTASVDVKIRTTSNSSVYGTSLSVSTVNSYILIQQIG